MIKINELEILSKHQNNLRDNLWNSCLDKPFIINLQNDVDFAMDIIDNNFYGSKSINEIAEQNLQWMKNNFHYVIVKKRCRKAIEYKYHFYSTIEHLEFKWCLIHRVKEERFSTDNDNFIRVDKKNNNCQNEILKANNKDVSFHFKWNDNLLFFKNGNYYNTSRILEFINENKSNKMILDLKVNKDVMKYNKKFSDEETSVLENVLNTFNFDE